MLLNGCRTRAARAAALAFACQIAFSAVGASYAARGSKHFLSHRTRATDSLSTTQNERRSRSSTDTAAQDLSGLRSLNQMLSNSYEDYTSRKAECKQVINNAEGELRDLEIVIQDAQTRLARATASLLEIQGDKTAKERELDRINEESRVGEKDCGASTAELRKELAEAEEEAKMTTEVLQNACPEKLGLPAKLTEEGKSDAFVQMMGGAVELRKCSRVKVEAEAADKRAASSSTSTSKTLKASSFPKRAEAFARRSTIGADDPKSGSGKSSPSSGAPPAGVPPPTANKDRFHKMLRTERGKMKHRRGAGTESEGGRSFVEEEEDVALDERRRDPMHLHNRRHLSQHRPPHRRHPHRRHLRRSLASDPRRWRRIIKNPVLLHLSRRRRSTGFLMMRRQRRGRSRFGSFARRSSGIGSYDRRRKLGRDYAAEEVEHEHADYVHVAHLRHRRPLQALGLLQTSLRALLKPSTTAPPFTREVVFNRNSGQEKEDSTKHAFAEVHQSPTASTTSPVLVQLKVPDPETCTPRLKPNCENFESAMTELLQSSAAQTEGKKREIDAQEQACENRRTLNAQLLQQTKDELATLNAKVAQLMADSGQAKNELSLQEKKRDQVKGEKTNAMGGCDAELAEAEDAMCKLRKARGEMILLKLTPVGSSVPSVEPQDCEATDWQADAAGQCRAKCATTGSVLSHFYATREIVTKNNEYGVVCPQNVEKKMACPASLRCSVDCEVSDWSEWSECSAHCGSGVRHRVRSVVRDPVAGGKSCPNTSDMESCSRKASCSSDCVLSEWTAWDGCSQTCGTGLQVRRRDVLQRQDGGGTCAAVASPERRQFKVCNNFKKDAPPASAPGASSASPGAPLVPAATTSCAGKKCSGKNDLVVLIDVSAGVDVAATVASVKKFLAKMVLDGKGSKMQVALVAVKGPSFVEMLRLKSPRTMAKLQKQNETLQAGLKTDTQLFLETGSGDEDSSSPTTVELLTSWTSDAAAVTASLDKLVKKAAGNGAAGNFNGPFDIYRGLATARELFAAPGARGDATSQVFVFSQSNFLPNYAKFSMLQTQRFRAHLVSVKIGGIGKSAAGSWVELSKELNQNFPKATINRTVFQFKSLKAFEEKFAEKLLPSMCGVDLV